MLAYGRNHPYGRPATGYPSTVEKLTKEDIHVTYWQTGASALINRNPNKKGLMPAWEPGQSGNPSGRLLWSAKIAYAVPTKNSRIPSVSSDPILSM
jgi:hypothetical protein